MIDPNNRTGILSVAPQQGQSMPPEMPIQNDPMNRPMFAPQETDPNEAMGTVLGMFDNIQQNLNSATSTAGIMNALRGDEKPVSARRSELASFVGKEDAKKTPASVLTMMQPLMYLLEQTQAQAQGQAPAQAPMQDNQAVQSPGNQLASSLIMSGQKPRFMNQGGPVTLPPPPSYEQFAALYGDANREIDQAYALNPYIAGLQLASSIANAPRGRLLQNILSPDTIQRVSDPLLQAAQAKAAADRESRLKAADAAVQAQSDYASNVADLNTPVSPQKLTENQMIAQELGNSVREITYRELKEKGKDHNEALEAANKAAQVEIAKFWLGVANKTSTREPVDPTKPTENQMLAQEAGNAARKRTYRQLREEGKDHNEALAAANEAAQVAIEDFWSDLAEKTATRAPVDPRELTDDEILAQKAGEAARESTYRQLRAEGKDHDAALAAANEAAQVAMEDFWSNLADKTATREPPAPRELTDDEILAQKAGEAAKQSTYRKARAEGKDHDAALAAAEQAAQVAMEEFWSGVANKRATWKPEPPEKISDFQKSVEITAQGAAEEAYRRAISQNKTHDEAQLISDAVYRQSVLDGWAGYRTQNTYIPPEGSVVQEEFAKGLFPAFDEARKQAATAAEAAQYAQVIADLSQEYKTGALAEPLLYVSKLSKYLGGEGVLRKVLGDKLYYALLGGRPQDAEVIRSMSRQLFVRLSTQIPGNLNQQEVRIVEEALPSLRLTPEGNAMIAKIYARMADLQYEQNKEILEYINANDGILTPTEITKGIEDIKKKTAEKKLLVGDDEAEIQRLVREAEGLETSAGGNEAVAGVARTKSVGKGETNIEFTGNFADDSPLLEQELARLEKENTHPEKAWAQISNLAAQAGIQLSREQFDANYEYTQE